MHSVNDDDDDEIVKNSFAKQKENCAVGKRDMGFLQKESTYDINEREREILLLA